MKHLDKHTEEEMSLGAKESPIHKTIDSEDKSFPKKMFTTLPYVEIFKIEKI